MLIKAIKKLFHTELSVRGRSVRIVGPKAAALWIKNMQVPLSVWANVSAAIVTESDELVFVCVLIIVLPDNSLRFYHSVYDGIQRFLPVHLRPLQIFSFVCSCSQGQKSACHMCCLYENLGLVYYYFFSKISQFLVSYYCNCCNFTWRLFHASVQYIDWIKRSNL